MKTAKTCAAALLSVLLAAAAQAQEPPAAPPPAPASPPAPAPAAAPLPPAARRPPTAMHVQIVVSRTQSGKAISRLPYTMTCIADGSGRPATLRMGVEVPIAVGGGKGIQYRNVGINIDSTCESLGDDRYRLKIAVEQSSISDVGRATPKPRAAADAPPGEDSLEAGNPMFRTFNSTFVAILRDGQSALSTAATDPVTSEDVTIEVSLKLLK